MEYDQDLFHAFLDYDPKTGYGIDYGQGEANAEAIANAPTDVARLLKIIQRAQGKLIYAVSIWHDMPDRYKDEFRQLINEMDMGGE